MLRIAAASGGLALTVAAQAEPKADAAFAAHIRPLLSRYCLKCHSAAKHKGDLDLEQFDTLDAVRRQPRIWQEVVAKLADEEMPPQSAKQPTLAERETLRSWAEAVLGELARAHAGDPGPVVLRRLNNAEFTHAVRDLTGLASLDPAKEFPVDGAAGEGFTNVGNALVMSPMLVQKYLAAARAIAAHVVLLPDGLRFSAATTRRDQTEELLAAIRALYRRYTESGGAETVDLQGIVFDTNGGGRLPLARYLAATLALRDGAHDTAAIAATAAARGLSPKYLQLLWQGLAAGEPSPVLDEVRRSWRTAGTTDAAAVAAAIAAWQQRLWQFRTVGHIGKVGGPTAWLEPASPFVARQELRCPVVAATDGAAATIHVEVRAAGDVPGSVVLQRPRLVAPGRPDLPLQGLDDLVRRLNERRMQLSGTASACLAAVAEAERASGPAVAGTLAVQHDLPADVLAAWLEALGVGTDTEVLTSAPLTDALRNVAGFAAVSGWAAGELPCVLANAGTEPLRVPGPLPPHSVAAHPTPTSRVVVAWRSPITAPVRVVARIQHTHTDCGNGVSWTLELRRGGLRLQLASGLAVAADAMPVTVAEPLPVRAGDRIALLIGARDGDHRCDLTSVDLTLTADGDGAGTWNLCSDVAADLPAGNPHADGYGNAGVWHFGAEPDRTGPDDAAIPAGSLLAQWLTASDAAERPRLAAAVQTRLVADLPAASAAERQFFSFDGPLYRDCRAAAAATVAADLVLRAPARLTVDVPAELAAGREFVATAELAAGAGGAAQVLVGTAPPAAAAQLVAAPILVRDGSAAHRRLEAAADAFRALFPPALCYEKIVPVDEVITLTLFHREDAHLVRLMLDEAEAAELDRLWAELRFVSRDALALVDVFDQLWQYATQDADPTVFEPLREPIRRRAAAFRAELAAAEPRHLDAVLAFADRAFRRPLAAGEADGLRDLYARLRAEPMPHEEAIRLLLARVLLAPAFLYRSEQPGPGAAPSPVTPHELAVRLSSCVWSSVPDADLRAAADSGALLDPDVLVAQARRMLADPRVWRLAVEFGCTWLHLRAFDESADKSDRHFPTFRALRGAMYEEVILVFTDLFQRDGSVLELLDGDHTFLNGPLARHYDIPGVDGDAWRRVDGVRQYGRGGVLGLGAVLASQSGASRTSPILRGNWVAEVLLGDRLPRPPKDVPKLPDDEADQALTVRELVERHRSDARCAHCHERIDPFGFALEGFDAIGRRRQRDLGDRPIDTRATTRDGASFEGLAGLRQYLMTARRDAFLAQFSRKFLGYALGRAVQLSDEPLLQSLRAEWPAHGHRFSFLLERVLRSPQFLQIRGRDHRE